MIANSKEQGNGRECNEEERLLRLFVVVAKDKAEEELKNYFDSFGTVQYVNIVRDRETKESKGFAYIKFYRLVHAAAAFELCEKSYKAVFAEPRPQRPLSEPHGRHQHGNPLQHLNNGFRNNRNGSSVTSQPGRAESCRLNVTGSSAINEDQLWRLFDLIPGLDYCEVREVCPSAHRIVGLAVYTSPAAAAYARKKLHGFEYPPGQRLIVRYEEGGVYISTPSPAASTPPPSLPLPGDLQSLADSIAHATSLLQAANLHDREGGAPPLHYSREGGVAPLHYPPPVTPLTIPAYDPAYCSISLPSPQVIVQDPRPIPRLLYLERFPSTNPSPLQPLVPMETTVGERLFLVCTPSPPPLYALKDVFSRFEGEILTYEKVINMSHLPQVRRPDRRVPPAGKAVRLCAL